MTDYKVQINTKKGLESFVEGLGENGKLEFKNSLIQDFAKTHLKPLMIEKASWITDSLMNEVRKECENKVNTTVANLKDGDYYGRNLKLKPEIVELISKEIETASKLQIKKMVSDLNDLLEVKVNETFNKYLENLEANISRTLDAKVQLMINSKIRAYEDIKGLTK